MNEGSSFEARLKRIKQAVSLDKPDRVPVVLEYGAFAAQVTKTPKSEFLLNLKRSVEVMIEAYQLVAEKGSADAMNYGSFSPYALSYLWLSKVKVPGVDLPEDVSYQVYEKELMTRDDYDVILEKGWPEFYKNFMREKVIDDVAPEHLPMNQGPANVKREWAKIGVPVLRMSVMATPFEYLCGGRSLNSFFLDLLDIPEKIEAVINAMMPYLSTPICEHAKKQGYPAVWVGGWRAAPAMLSHEMWERFVWKHFRQQVYDAIEHGLIPLLHLDSDWTRELESFRELPKGKVIMALDGETDIFKAKEVLGDHMCLMGDVPPAMLSFDSPDTVYDYCSKLIREVGPEGFILQSGCDIPENAKLENVQAMVAAAFDS